MRDRSILAATDFDEHVASCDTRVARPDPGVPGAPNMHALTAKVFMNGGSQAIRLPAECRFDTAEVLIEKVGQSLVITPKRRGGWEEFFGRPSAVPDGFLSDRNDAPSQSRGGLD